MTAALVQSNKGISAVATTTASFLGATTSGNVVILKFTGDDYNTTPNAGWTQSAEMKQEGFHGAYLWQRVSAGETNFQYTINTATNSSWILEEWSGLNTGSLYDTSQGSIEDIIGGTTSTLATDAITPTTGSRLLSVLFGGSSTSTQDGNTVTGLTNSFTSIDAIGSNGGGGNTMVAAAYRVVTGDGVTTFSTSGTYGASVQSRTALIISLKISTGNTTTQKTMTDTVLTTDQGLDNTTRIRRMDESVPVSDPQVQWTRRSRLVADALTVIDAFVKTVSFGSGVFVKVMTDTLSPLDGFVDWLRRVREGIDSVVLTDGGIPVRYYIITGSDAVEFSDGFVSMRRLRRIIDENLDVIDSFSKTLAGAGIVYAKVMSDTVTLIDDAGQRWKFRLRQLSDTAGLSDAVLDACRRVRVLGESIELSEGTVKIGQHVLIAADTIGLSDETIKSLAADQIYTVALKFGHYEPNRFGGR